VADMGRLRGLSLGHMLLILSVQVTAIVAAVYLVLQLRKGFNWADLGLQPLRQRHFALAALAGLALVAVMEAAERLLGEDAFQEIHIEADLATCEARDPKGLYKRARSGEIRDFTGVSAPYEAPDKPDLVIDTGGNAVDQCVDEVLAYVDSHYSARK